MKYKVGSRVRVQSLDWYNKNKNMHGNVPIGQFSFNSCNKHLCGTILTIKRVLGNYYLVKENDAYWTDEMIEGLVEKETKPIHFINIAIKPHNVRGDEIIKMLEELGGTNAFSFDGSDHNCVNPFAYYIDNDDKQIYGGGIDFLRKNGYKIHTLEELKKKEYPKTYEECCKILGCKADHFFTDFSYKGCDVEISDYEDKINDLLRNFRKLIICRDAYWKIAGEEMELGKDLPWVPDWMCIDPIYVILYQYHAIYKAEVNGGTSCILAFPTKEMRDAFYENFKELIEQCKKLL